MSAISYKAKPFVALDPNFLNHSSTKRVEVAMKIELGNLKNKSTLLESSWEFLQNPETRINQRSSSTNYINCQ